MEKPFEQHVCCDLCGADDAEQILRKQERLYVRCRRCGFIYTNPRVSEPAADNVELFEARKQEYLQAQYSRRKQRAYARRLRRFAPYRKTGRLVEIVKVESSGVRSPRGSGNFVVSAIRKAALSLLSRHTLKGDRLVVLGRKPA